MQQHASITMASFTVLSTMISLLVFVAIFRNVDVFKDDGSNLNLWLRHKHRSLSLCLDCGLNITFLEENDTMAPTELPKGPTSPPAVVPDSQPGVALPPPTAAPSVNGTSYNDTITNGANINTASHAFADVPSENPTSEETQNNNANTGGSGKRPKSSKLRPRARGKGMIWELRDLP